MCISKTVPWGTLITGIFLILAGCNSAGIKHSDSGQEKNISFAEYCASNPCRKNVDITLRTEKQDFHQTLELYWPVVQKDRISLLPGETVYVEADLVDGKAVNLKSVSSIEKPESTLTFTFEQEDDDIGMVLSVKNPFSANLKYHLDMIDFQGIPHHTSSCPAIATGGAYEMWPHPIPEIVVSDIHVVTEKEGFGCVY